MQPVRVTLAAQGITCQFEPSCRADDLVGSMTIAADGCFGVALCQLLTVNAHGEFIRRPLVAITAGLGDVVSIHGGEWIGRASNRMRRAMAISAGRSR